ncbi:DUF167 domain-containing protein [Agromyces soli]|uniref:UPF0235 protein MTP13_15560 n=1 Tax=Agromyces soli TaxID=659012 RepID=A0ABY4ARC2_9MICO|nr:DUF167 domain-containing protein [Agromyces soli]UOE25720.1 DUF167 domain-containing protein [Agromyces soli]
MELTVRVKPGSRKGPLVEPSPEDPAAALTVFVRERAVDGAANAGVIQALAAHFGVPRRDVVIVRGETSRIKRVRIEER